MQSDGSATVGTYEARTRFAELLERVERGEEITITRHGAPVARLVPARKPATAAQRQSAIAAMRQLAANNRLRGLRIKDLSAEGRR
ncbi:MAG: type II toxin-antitoxin system prevent-host-death family antitoxin [Pirellulales bacterium]